VKWAVVIIFGSVIYVLAASAVGRVLRGRDQSTFCEPKGRDW